MRPAEFGSDRTRRSGVRTRRNPRNGDTKRMRGTRPMHLDGSRKGKIGSAFTPPPFGGPRSHGRNGGLVLLGARPRTTYPRLSLLEGTCKVDEHGTVGKDRLTRSKRAHPCLRSPLLGPTKPQKHLQPILNGGHKVEAGGTSNTFV
ncbi:hypothetical protein CRENBAI_001656 [Crenichthys baileyi]|uniref:Uncharacterized protein n=1 Tax=Crenichthys baileyi TaxID=28760 RepID=A0AAV9SGE2_9TELE